MRSCSTRPSSGSPTRASSSRRARARRNGRPRPGGRAGDVRAVPTRSAPGRRLLRCSFTGVLNDKLRGFYRSTLRDEAGATHTIATSQMESTDARRAFPCFDEPDRKAVFEITLVIDDDLVAYSNAPVVSEDAAGPRPKGGAVRRDDGDVVVPGGAHRGPARGDRAPRRRRGAGAGRPRPGQGAPGRASRSKSPSTRSASSRTYFAIPYPAEKLDLVGDPRLRLRGHGEPGVRDLPGDRPPRRRTAGGRAWTSSGSPTSSPTRSPTCGSATSSP